MSLRQARISRNARVCPSLRILTICLNKLAHAGLSVSIHVVTTANLLTVTSPKKMSTQSKYKMSTQSKYKISIVEMITRKKSKFQMGLGP